MSTFFLLTYASRRKLGRAVFLGATILGLLTSTLATSVQVQAQTQGQQPKYGGTLIIGVTGGWSLPTLNPNLGYVLTVASKIYNGLLEFDVNLNPKPDLAESWEISEDGRTYTFHLVRNATFHDGKPVTSADVKFSIEQVLIPYDPVGKSTWEPLESIETPDEYTVVINLKEPSSSLLYMLSVGSGGLAVLPKHLYEETDIPNNPYNLKPIGSGPFRFVSWEKGNQIVLERNENYFREGLPYLDRIIIRIIADETALGLALENGEIDYAPVGLSFPDAKRLKELENIDVVYSGREGLGVLLTLVMNLDNPILANQKVRQAIAYAIDRNLINERVYLNQQKVAQGLVSSTVSWAFNPDVQQKYDYDPEKANRLLDEAGYPMQSDGKRFTISVHNYAGLPDRIKMLEIMREQLRDVGIDLKVITLENAAVSDAVYKNRDFDSLLVFIWTGPDPVPILTQPLHSKQIGIQYGNAGGYRNERVDDLLGAAAQEADRDKETQLLYELQDILVRELPIFPLFEAAIPSGYSKEFVGLGVGPWLPNDSIEQVWWTGGKSNTETINTLTSSAAPDASLVTAVLIVVAVISIGGGIGAYILRRRNASS